MNFRKITAALLFFALFAALHASPVKKRHHCHYPVPSASPSTSASASPSSSISAYPSPSPSSSYSAAPSHSAAPSYSPAPSYAPPTIHPTPCIKEPTISPAPSYAPPSSHPSPTSSAAPSYEPPALSPSPSVSAAPAPLACKEAYDMCEFTFHGAHKGKIPEFNANGAPDVPFTSHIVPKSGKYTLGALNMNGVVPEFIDVLGAEPITEFADPPFTPTHIKPYARDGYSFIGHQTYHGSQSHNVKERCIRVFFTNFQVLTKNAPRQLIANKNNVPPSANKCVVFKTL